MSRWFVPYHNGVEALVSAALASSRDPVVLAVHSMTPVLNGEVRTWPIALSSHEDKRLATPMLAALRKRIGFLVGDSQPYALDPAEDYTVPVHAMRRALRHLQVEFRQDLVASEQGAAKWAAVFGDALAEVLGL
jgi:predicted N-formylglutamate amidohydrolase